MNRPLHRLLLPMLLLGGLGLAGIAQEPAGGKRKDPDKAAEPGKAKGKAAGKAAPDKGKLPPGTIIVVPKDFEKGLPTGRVLRYCRSKNFRSCAMMPRRRRRK